MSNNNGGGGGSWNDVNSGGRGRGGRKGGRGGGRGRGRGRGGGGGRGRGRGRRDNNDNNNNNSNGQSNYPGNNNTNPRREPRQPLVPNTKKNGEKGADAHTVSEKTRIRFTQILMDFRENEHQIKSEFPPGLTNTERKFLHQLAIQLGLKSKSSGKGEKRFITVTKPDHTVKQASSRGGFEGEGLPVLKIGRGGFDALATHVSKFPPTKTEELESRETGASLVAALSQQQQQPSVNNTNDSSNNNAGVLDALNRLGLGGDGVTDHTSKKVHRPNIRKHVDTRSRIQRHTFYQKKKQEAKEYKQVLRNRANLPAYGRQEEIVATVAANPVTIIQGETGCGKSTQCPQFLLDANPDASIAVTQPRRISAISIAERVAEEQCLASSSSSSQSSNNAGVGSLVGYQVRLESASSRDTQLLFLTPGVLLRKLQSSPMLSEYTHIIIDEVHERDKYTEFLMIRLRDLLPLRPDLRLVLMSATLQTEVLLNYFAPSVENGSSTTNNAFYLEHPPVMLSIEGRTFPVQEFFLEHALELTEYIDIDAFDDVEAEDGGNNRVVEKPMSMNQLDAALAKLMSNGGSQVDINVMAGMEITTKCVLCGKGFPGPIQLGEHMALCTGLMGDLVGDEDTILLPEDGVKTAAFSTPQFLGGNTEAENSAFNDGDFEEYDEDECQEAAEYNFQEILTSPNNDSSIEEKNGEKWDGEGLFQADVEQEVKLTANQEKYLKCYQTMYNDQQVNVELLTEVLHYIVKNSHGEGAILVFLPGWQDISEVSMLLENTVPFNNRSKYMVLPLHSGIPSQDQRKVLRRPPPGSRKIVLSTNIAETSLTIEDVAFVVDTGRAKEKDYDPHLKTSTLQPVWISQSSSKQRKGRAGRTKAGVCFHLFSSTRHQSMRPFVESELLRTPLEEMCLMTKKLGLAPGGPEDEDGIPAFLSKAITPPHAKSISNALELLVDLGAVMPETNDLTTLGECLSVLSLEPRVGKMVIWSYLLGCTKIASQMAVAMAYKSPFVLPPQHMRREAEKSQLTLSNGSESDQVTILNAIGKRDQLKKKGEGAYRNWCRDNFVSPSSLQMIGDLRKNLTRELSSLGFADPMAGGYQNRHINQHSLWQAAIAAGLYPNVATRKQGEVNFSTMTNRKAKIHVSSVNSLKGQPLNSKCQIPKGELEFVCFGEMVKGSHFFTLSQTTHLPSVLPILLLCGTSLSIHPIVEGDGDEIQKHKYSILNLDNWIAFKCTTDVASRLVILRRRLESAFWNAIAKPSRDLSESLNPIERDAIETLGLVLNSAVKSSNVR